MDLFEFQGKELLARFEIPVPEGRVARTPPEARAIATSLSGAVAVKCQTRAGGRGKAGGVQIAQMPEHAEHAAESMLGTQINGQLVECVLVERASNIAEEYYAAITLDRSAGKPLAMLSAKGGVDIEKVAGEDPQALKKVWVDPLLGLSDFHARQLTYGVAVDSAVRPEITKFFYRLWRLFLSVDCLLVEVNPLALTVQGEVLALDAKVQVDDSALYRHPELAAMQEHAVSDPLEQAARRRGLNFVKLDGDVGVIGNGAGLVMSTLDLVAAAGGRPANFLDVGGGANEEVLSTALEHVAGDSRVRVVLVNIFGGITRCDSVASGILNALSRLQLDTPVVVRLDGTNAQLGHTILERANHPQIVQASTMDEAAGLAVKLSRRAGA